MKNNPFPLGVVILYTVLIPAIADNSLGQVNYVPAGSDAMDFGTINLETPGGQSWSTARAAAPGYFSMYRSAVLFAGKSVVNRVNEYIKIGKKAFSFPIGTGVDLRTFSMSAPSSVPDQYGAAWIPGNSTIMAMTQTEMFSPGIKCFCEIPSRKSDETRGVDTC